MAASTLKDKLRNPSRVDHFPSQKSINRKDLLGVEHLDVSEILWLLDKSDEYYNLLTSSEALPKLDLLGGRTIANLFFESSTRTRISFELAERRLGANFASLSTATSSLTKGESLLDTVQVINAMKVDAIVVRHQASGVPGFLAERLPSHVHVVNAGDGAHEHPTQALLDAATMRMAIGDLAGKHLVIIGDIRHSRVARSNIWLLKKLKMRITLVGPETLMPRYAKEVFGVDVRNDIGDTLASADAVMALRMQLERQQSGLFPSLDEFHSRYGLSATRMGSFGGYLLHPGPINLGVEMDAYVSYGANSLVLRQVKRGVAIRMAYRMALYFDLIS